MNAWINQPRVVVLGLLLLTVAAAGCATVGGTAGDVGLAGAGGVAGYQLSDGKIGGAAAGAALGYAASRIAQSEVRREMSEAEKRGYDRALNQAVKQQYWLIQAQQRERAETAEPKLVPVAIPESNINGVIRRAHVEYIRVES